MLGVTGAVYYEINMKLFMAAKPYICIKQHIILIVFELYKGYNFIKSKIVFSSYGFLLDKLLKRKEGIYV